MSGLEHGGNGEAQAPTPEASAPYVPPGKEVQLPTGRFPVPRPPAEGEVFTLDEEEKRYSLSEIKKDMTYFGKSYKRADMTVDIKGLSIDDAVSKIEAIIRTRLH